MQVSKVLGAWRYWKEYCIIKEIPEYMSDYIA